MEPEAMEALSMSVDHGGRQAADAAEEPEATEAKGDLAEDGAREEGQEAVELKDEEMEKEEAGDGKAGGESLDVWQRMALWRPL